jgi:DNA-binding NarL/FixJ family response regulator
MHSKKLNLLPRSEPGNEPFAAPRHWPQLVFAREDSAGSDEQAEAQTRILVVEDDYLIASDMKIALSDAGFDVAGIAASADEAVELAESQNPALAVIDVRLGGDRDGIDAAVEIFRKLGIRCIFATAHYDEHSVERARPAMPLGWLQKPYSGASLVNAVRRALEELDS